MRKLPLFSAVLTLFLLVPASITWAQTISSQKGLTTAVFPTQFGSLKVYWPDDTRPGEVISGMVVAEPNGNTAKQIEKNLAGLLDFSIRINSQSFPIDNKESGFQCTLPSDNPVRGLIELINVSGGNVGGFTIQAIAQKDQRPAPVTCSVPTHALTGSPLQLAGPFDGNSSNTNCTLDNKPLLVLAESPRQCFVSYPDNAKGIQTLNVQEKNQPNCSHQVSAVNMGIRTGKLNLQKGESTWLECTITGLEGLNDAARLSVTNESTDVVVLGGGNTQWFILKPEDEPTGNYYLHPPWWDDMLPKAELIPWHIENIKSDQSSWEKRWDIQSLKTGSYTINIDLVCPGPYSDTLPLNGWELPIPDSPFVARIPPGQSGKKCDCVSTASIVAGQGLGVYKAIVSGDCTGLCGDGPTTLTRCHPPIIKYKWSIDIKKGVEGPAPVIVGADNQEIVIVKEIDQWVPYTITLTATTLCDCDGSCTSTATKDRSRTRANEPPPVPKACKCECVCDVDIIANGNGGNAKQLNFTAVPNNCGCNGFFGIDPPGCKPCKMLGTAYNWTVTAGFAVVRIIGNAKLPVVNIQVIGSGAFMLTAGLRVTCSDGFCDCHDHYQGYIPPPPPDITNQCELLHEEKMEPEMSGGLKSKYIVSGKLIGKDGSIALGAEGMDMDQLKWTCQPRPLCFDTKSEKTILLNGRVKFAWDIIAGEGSFVNSSSLSAGSKTEEGENVIFKPALIPLPVSGADTSITTTIKLSVIDDNLTQPKDPQVDRTITIIVKRSKSKPDFYSVDIKSEKYSLPGSLKVPGAPGVSGTCMTIGPDWVIADELPKPAISLTGVPDNYKMLPGQWIVLSTNDQRDKDGLVINCKSTNKCKTEPWSKVYEDKVIWSWSIISGGGKFVSDPTGRFIIYEALAIMPKGKDFIEVKIHVKVTNAGGKISDKEMDGEIVFKVYKSE